LALQLYKHPDFMVSFQVNHTQKSQVKDHSTWNPSTWNPSTL